MKLWIADLLDRIDALSLRERVLVLVALLALIAIAWDLALMQPLARARVQREPQIVALRAEVARLDSSIEELARTDSAGPAQALLGQLAQTRTGIVDLDRQLGGLTHGLIAPQEMVEVLKQVLASTAPLELISLRSLPATPLAALMPGEELPARIFRHGVELELEGGYLDLVEFLKALDALPWRFYWHSLELDVQEHPLLRVRLTAHTLGLEEAWLGV